MVEGFLVYHGEGVLSRVADVHRLHSVFADRPSDLFHSLDGYGGEEPRDLWLLAQLNDARDVSDGSKSLWGSKNLNRW
jgi:hypothetical protein